MPPTLPTQLISIIDIARIHGQRKQATFRIVRRLGLNVEEDVGLSTRGQKASHVAVREYETHKHHFIYESFAAEAVKSLDHSVNRSGFYLISTEPELDPGRFKVGFSNDADERMRSHRTSAPLAELVRTWPCKQLWERTAIDCVAAGCERLGPEVLRTHHIGEVIARADQFFALMPALWDE